MKKDIVTSGIYGFLVIQIKSCPGDKMQRRPVCKVGLQLCNVGCVFYNTVYSGVKPLWQILRQNRRLISFPSRIGGGMLDHQRIEIA